MTRVPLRFVLALGAPRAAAAAGLALVLFAATVLTATGTAAQQYGGSVAVAGGHVLVGESSNVSLPGVVYVYGPSADGWEETGRLAVSAVGERPDGFGRSLAADGATLLVGAPNWDGGRGAAIVFQAGADGQWREVARLAWPDGAGDAGSRADPVGGDAEMEDPNFGAAVSLSGDVALVSAPGERGASGAEGAPGAEDADGAEDGPSGAVYLFTRDASGAWSQRDRYVPADGATPRFGAGLSTDGSVALVATAPARGAAASVHVLRVDETAGTLRPQGRLDPAGQLAPTDPQRPGSQRFGASLAIHDGAALVGAPGASRGAGAVVRFAFDPETDTWLPEGALVAFDAQPRASFGTSLAVHDDALWVGAPGAGSNGSGAVYRFAEAQGDAGWTQAVKIAGSELPSRASFGSSVAFAGEVGVVGAGGVDSRAGGVLLAGRDADGGWSWSDLTIGEYRGLPAIAGRDEEVPCMENAAAGFECDNVNIISFLPIKEMAGSRGSRLNDVWGWTDPETGREIAIVGRTDGTAFVDVTDPFNPLMLGDLPKTPGSRSSVWRDMKVYRNHTYIVADGAGEHGVQVFDLTRLRNEGGPDAVFEPDYTYPGIHSAHNIVVNEQTGFAYAVGSSGGGETCGGGLHMLALDEPSRPTFAGCFAHANTGRRGTGYSHDAQCVIYHGPDEEHQGREICLGSNETRLSIADVTDKDAPVALASVDYPSVVYAHQGWLTEDHRYFYMNDEGDEPHGLVEGTRTLVWDVMDLDEPVLVKEYIAETPDTDHNLYIRGNLMYQSNYGAGLRILDISDPVEPEEIAYFDTTPWQGGASWSNYPYFESGIIVVTSTGDGLFLVRNTARRNLIP